MLFWMTKSFVNLSDSDFDPTIAGLYVMTDKKASKSNVECKANNDKFNAVPFYGNKDYNVTIAKATAQNDGGYALVDDIDADASSIKVQNAKTYTGTSSAASKATTKLYLNDKTSFVAAEDVKGDIAVKTATGSMKMSEKDPGYVAVIFKNDGNKAAYVVYAGADLGSALAARILTLNISSLIPILLIAGTFLFLRRMEKREGQFGRMLLGFAFVLLALQSIMASTEPMRDSPIILETLAHLPEHPFLAAAVGIACAVLFFLQPSRCRRDGGCHCERSAAGLSRALGRIGGKFRQCALGCSRKQPAHQKRLGRRRLETSSFGSAVFAAGAACPSTLFRLRAAFLHLSAIRQTA